MIKFNCDRCDMEIELDDEFAGTKHECLNCGDINRVPIPEGSDATLEDPDPAVDSKNVDRAAKAGFPPDFGPETRVIKVRRCWFRSRAIRFSLLVLIGLTSLIGLIWVPVTDKSVWWYALFAPLLLASVGILAWWWVDRLSASLEITTKRTTDSSPNPHPRSSTTTSGTSRSTRPSSSVSCVLGGSASPLQGRTASSCR